MKRFLLPVASVVIGAAISGCSLIVWSDAEGATCADDGECGAGFVCVEGACVDGVAQGIPAEGLIDSAGGVLSAHGLTLTVPAGALERAVVFVIEVRSATLPQDNVDAEGPPIRVEPELTFVTQASVTLEGDGALFRQRADGDADWERLSDSAVDVELAKTGTFVVGVDVDLVDDDDSSGSAP